jgi:SAM-dependent methyltransferase
MPTFRTHQEKASSPLSAKTITMQQPNYDATFFRNVEDGAMSSAEVVLPIVQQHLAVRSIVDFGCGNGVWLNVWKRLGAERVQGLDGSWVDLRTLWIDTAEFTQADLSQPVDLHRTFDLVQSLEVAEHIPNASAEVFIDNLVRHGRQILFSAAVPGQLGVQHVNERPYGYWRDLFAKRNYVLLDAIRPVVRHVPAVKWWYRYNTFLYVEKSHLATLGTNTIDSLIEESACVPDIAPWWCRAGRCLTRLLSVRDSTRVANWFLSREARQKPSDS